MSKIVLIVDDSIVSRMMLKEIVKSYIPEVNIIEAGGGEQCLSQITAKSKIDIAIFDYNMPGMTGFELISALEKLISIPKRALLTANIQDEIKQQAEQVGVVFLNKPITEELISNFLMS
ncbi:MULTISPECIES: response regulator [unclassified Colwellia]|uniref:response regulator n=1 Tax=unclassified Colwellia TaxID=196834 RepID=UPI0015F65F93|nr:MULTISPECIES: response regulator [unclassified Colwellia]MBA6233567.1 response regulator [Colwellia sp. MB02u-7]MBA6238127.1 response regulator [Colwellia sp. MB02u-11]MBA6257356.1 response regulator [Colwellia sp. MB3u-28]MBA6258940.1 response regulator [Colwellia sp. MB3u-41]MBA6299736.1 response regulator [Colwellia sp. MB3u-22]